MNGKYALKFDSAICNLTNIKAVHLGFDNSSFLDFQGPQ